TNYRMKRLRFSLELLLRTDFADIFEVKAKRVVRKGNISTSWDQEKTELISVYEHNGFSTSMITRLIHSSSVPIYNNGRVSFPIDLAPKAIWHSCCQYMMALPKRRRSFTSACTRSAHPRAKWKVISETVPAHWQRRNSAFAQNPLLRIGRASNNKRLRLCPLSLTFSRLGTIAL